MKTTPRTIWLLASSAASFKNVVIIFNLSIMILFQPLLLAEDGKGPEYKGKTLSYWLYEYENVPGQPLIRAANFNEEQTNALLSIGTNGLPFLMKRLSALSLVTDGVTIPAFQVLGPLARSAIPQLVQLVTNQPGSIRFDRLGGIGLTPGSGALKVLAAIGKDAVPALLDILTNSSSTARRLKTFEAIETIGTNAVSALPVLRGYVFDSNSIVAVEAARAIGTVGSQQSAGFETLREIQQNSNLLEREVRAEILGALGSFGGDCASVVIPALDDEDNYFLAFTILVASAPDGLTNAAALRSAAKGLRSLDSKRQDWAVQMLWAAGQQAGGQHLECPHPGGDTKAIYPEATNVLSRLAPELYDEYLAAAVPFHILITNTPSN